MKRIIYTLTAILSAVAAAIHIIESITDLYQFGTTAIPDILIYRGIQIAVLLAISILSFVQLKKPTPRIMLLLCGYVFYESVLMINYMYLFGLLLMAAALVPAVYELSHYGMLVRQEPRQIEKNGWMLAAALALSLALCACRAMLIITQASLNTSGGIPSFSIDYLGISTLICAAVFCALMSRRTSMLYRMFFTGCVVFDTIRTIFTLYFFMQYFISDYATIFFISMAAIYAIFVLLILVHALLTRRGSLIIKGAPDITELAFNNAGNI